MEQMLAPEFVRQLSRHRTGHLRRDRAVGNLRFAGARQLRDTDRVLAAIAKALPTAVISQIDAGLSARPPEGSRRSGGRGAAAQKRFSARHYRFSGIPQNETTPKETQR